MYSASYDVVVCSPHHKFFFSQQKKIAPVIYVFCLCPDVAVCWALTFLFRYSLQRCFAFMIYNFFLSASWCWPYIFLSKVFFALITFIFLCRVLFSIMISIVFIMISIGFFPMLLLKGRNLQILNWSSRTAVLSSWIKFFLQVFIFWNFDFS